MKMGKINLVELLKDCPNGMELDCTMYDNVTLSAVIDNRDNRFPIKIDIGANRYRNLTETGCYDIVPESKCVIFPKGKTTWEGFVPPCKFKKGDVLVSELGNIVLLSHIDSENIVHYHCIIPTYGSFRIEENTNVGVGRYYECVLANEQQRQRMYEKIKCSGYKYNQQLNKLEKLVEPKFKVGDRIKNSDNCRSSIVVEIKDDCFIIKTLDGLHNSYLTDKLPFSKQDGWELISDKFNINTLKPFDKVLVRGDVGQRWIIDFFGFMDNKKGCPFVCVGHYVIQCIPYEGNEHLLDTDNDCDEYYKNWN